ncbi:hypothetical protein ACFQRK_21970 [Parapedobacter sp. GCM10030251]|uniref:hypothetical protein n=1 Tax=Parapedobacter sp. GCM10030251 TaxID=3273419 RepID=UPI00361CE423
MAVHLKITGVLLVALAFIHMFFPRYFNWRKELMGLSLINRQMMLVHVFFIALTVFLMGLLCLTHTDELISTGLGKAISSGLGIFWVIRLAIQFFGYASELWRGKAFETTVHLVFSLLWVYFSTVFLWVGIVD